MKVEFSGYNALNYREMDVVKPLAITALVLGALATITACTVDGDAYKACAENCFQLFGGADRAYDACISNCAARFLNPGC